MSAWLPYIAVVLFAWLALKDSDPVSADTSVLRGAREGFDEVADILEELADDPSVSPMVFDKVCRAVFTVLTAWVEDRA